MQLRYREHLQQSRGPGRSSDPTNTKTIREGYTGEVFRRFRAVKGKVREAVQQNDAFGRNQERLAPDSFDTEAEFDRWLDERFDEEVLNAQQSGRVDRGRHWTGSYITAAYRRGGKDAGRVLKRLGVIDAEMVDTELPYPRLPVHQDVIRSLWRRQFSELDGITDATAQQMRRELSQGLIDGDGARALADRLNDRIDKIGITRAKTMARTETVAAHNEAALTRYERHDIDSVTTVAEFTTAGDSKVCEQCQRLSESGGPNNDGTWPIEDARGVIPWNTHPNCRCTWVPITNQT